jgi:hypothetical protein
MEGLAHIIRRGMELLLWPIDHLPPLLGLTLVSIVTGIVLLWLVGKTTPQKLVGRARDRMSSAIYEILLYLDSPGRVFRAQGRLLTGSLVYLATMLPALLVAAIPLGLLFLHLEPRYGLSPLEIGKPIVVKAELESNADGERVEVRDGTGVKVAGPPLYLKNDHKLYTRVVPLAGKDQRLTFQVGDKTIEKSLRAGATDQPAPERRQGLATLWQIGDEAPLPQAGITAITFAHPENPRSFLGMPWWLYWLLVATIAAILLRNRFDVAI